MEKLKELLATHHADESVSIAEAAYRWLIHHSFLDSSKGDKIVVGASRIDQLQLNMS